MKYDRIEAMRQDYPITVLCRVFDVGASGYYAWRCRPNSPRARENARLELEIAAAHERTRHTYGRERLQDDLRDHGVRVGLHRIRRIRAQLALRCKQKRKFKNTTDSKHDLPVASNLLNRKFDMSAPNQAWVSDITHVWTEEGWLYLAGIKDLFNGELGGYAMSERMTRTLVMQALFGAVALKRPPAGLILHSDRGILLKSKTKTVNDKNKKRHRRAWRNCDSLILEKSLVGRAGFEPATNGLKVRCSTN